MFVPGAQRNCFNGAHRCRRRGQLPFSLSASTATLQEKLSSAAEKQVVGCGTVVLFLRVDSAFPWQEACPGGTEFCRVYCKKPAQINDSCISLCLLLVQDAEGKPNKSKQGSQPLQALLSDSVYMHACFSLLFLDASIQ